MKSIYLLVAYLLLLPVAYAQKTEEKTITKDSIIHIEEVIVTGNPTTDPVLHTVSNNYSEQIVQPKNVADMFSNLNGFSIIKRGNYAVDPSFRASQYEQLNVQYDGGVKVMNACPNRMDPITSHVAPETIERIEIIKGPYSVRYGASFGGIVNLVTHDPTSLEKGFHGSVASGYETNGNAYVGMTQLKYITNKFDVSSHFGYRNYDNYEDGDDVEIPSAFKSTNYGFKLGYNMAHNQRMVAGWKQAFGRDVLHAGLPMDTDYDNSSVATLDYKWQPNTDKVEYIQVKSYYSYVDHLMTNHKRSTFAMMNAEALVDATTTGGKIEVLWKPITHLKMYSGADYLHIDRDGTKTRVIKMQNGTILDTPITKVNSIWQDSYINDMGIFTEAKWNVATKSLLTLGIRYDHVTSDINNPEDGFTALYSPAYRTEHNVSGTTSLKQILTPNWYLEFAYGHGVRSANMIERYIYQFNVGQDSYTYTGNPNLKAETNDQFEVGVNGVKSFNGFFDKLHLESSVYYSILNNYISAIIDADYGTNAKVFTNINNAYKTGAEVAAELTFANHYFFKTEAAYIYAKNKDFDESLPLVPPFQLRLSTGIEKEKYWLNVRYNITATQHELAYSFGEITTANYETLDIKMGYKPIPKLTLGVAVLNLLDETYHNHLNFAFKSQTGVTNGTPITEPGRNFTAFVQYKF
ncbi:ligand-gated channel [Neptunitalea chrysea]|uniref:Ligand-gated channel n=1 Tax=Neptunitalea chrysea TaxID=1647581 RepID=A0A9W6B349_9FLAO|nr:TonB-dependent receptor [Neptunitalea chrysea]GLB51521.1 ligand-gated channel [Neptunitalea chrysea]